jgi:hypothetical protein
VIRISSTKDSNSSTKDDKTLLSSTDGSSVALDDGITFQ